MVAKQPYIYSAPKSYSQLDPYDGFDPKVFTRASQEPRTYPRSSELGHHTGQTAPNGPLLNFNKHPDSWTSSTYVPRYPTEPMPASTKSKIKVTRGLQLFLRIVQFIAAAGIMFCMVVVKNTADTEGIVIRIPATVDLLACLYAILHLSRAAKARAPSSSASYHLFAMAIDLALVPFYIYIALAVRNNLSDPTSDKHRWTTMFKSFEVTDDVFQVTWITSVTIAGLHIASACVSGFLFVIFRRIMNLPPDLNPLEDNLTSRRKSKHKHKTSEAMTEKHGSTFSLGSTIYNGIGSERSSPTKTATRPVSFLHTRQESDIVYSPHNPTTAHASRVDFASALDVTYASVPRNTVNADFWQSSETLTETAASNKSHTFWSEPSSNLPTMSNSSMYTAPGRVGDVPPLPRKSSKREGPVTQSENWSLQDENRPTTGVSIIEEEPASAMATISHFGLDAFRKGAYQPLRQETSKHPSGSKEVPSQDRMLQPLRMNPPTPVGSLRGDLGRRASPVPRPLSTTSGNSISSPKRKTKGYGHLSMSTPERDSGYSEAEWMKPGLSPRLGREGQDVATDGQGRVVSRSGVDITDARLHNHHDDHTKKESTGFKQQSLHPSWGGNGLRQVSGKAAEEGMAGHGSWWRRRTSGQGNGNGAWTAAR